MNLQQYLTLILVFAAPNLTAQPALEIIGGNVKDWGIVRQANKALAAKIMLKNIGTKELVIASVTPSCGCTTAPIEQSRLQPGASTNINVTLNLTPTAIGQQIKTITITSNDPTKPVQTLSLKAEILRSLQPSANFIAFSPIQAGKRALSSVRLKNTTDSPMIITNISAQDGLSVNRKTPFTIAPQKDIELAVSLIPSAKSTGYFHSQIVIKTDNTDQPTLPINVYGDIKPSASAKK
jgi:hypothetical protein